MALKNLNIRLNEMTLDPSPEAWHKIDRKLKKENSGLFGLNFKIISIAASVVLILGWSMFFAFDNQYSAEMVDSMPIDAKVLEFYNIAKSNELALAYIGKLN
jgi:hypothetical protein